MIFVHTAIPFSESLCSKRTTEVASTLIRKYKKAGLDVPSYAERSIIALAHYVAEKSNLGLHELDQLSLADMEWGCLSAIEKNMSIADTAIVLTRQLYKTNYRHVHSRLRNTNAKGFPKLHAWNVEHMKLEYQKLIKFKDTGTYWAEQYMDTFHYTGAPELRTECYNVRQRMIDKYYRTKEHKPEHTIEPKEEHIYWTWYWHFQFPLPEFVTGDKPQYPHFRDYRKNDIVLNLENPLDLVGKCVGIMLSNGRKSGGREELLMQMLSYLDGIPLNIHEFGHLALYYALKKEPEYKDFLSMWTDAQKDNPDWIKFQSLDHLAPTLDSPIKQALWINRMLQQETLNELEIPAAIISP